MSLLPVYVAAILEGAGKGVPAHTRQVAWGVCLTLHGHPLSEPGVGPKLSNLIPGCFSGRKCLSKVLCKHFGAGNESS